MKELQDEFIADLYPTLKNLTETSLQLEFKDGSKDSEGNYKMRSLIVSPVMLDLNSIDDGDSSENTLSYIFYLGVVP